MITQLAAEMRELIVTYAHLQKTASQVSLINNTADGLAELAQGLQAWARAYPAIEQYLGEEQKAELVKQASKLRQRLVDSRARFLTNEFTQRDALKQTQQILKKLTDDTSGCWYMYATSQIRPLRDQSTFAQQLPRMRTEIDEINTILAEVTVLAQKLPGRQADVTAFNKQIAALEKKLLKIKGVTREQTAFLNKIQAGTATLDDITTSLLDWCKQEGLATLLKIKF